MEIQVVKEEKNEIEISAASSTVFELLRNYLYKEGVEFAAWRREHPSKPFIMRIQNSEKPVKKIISDAVSAIKKDCDKIVSLAKK